MSRRIFVSVEDLLQTDSGTEKMLHNLLEKVIMSLFEWMENPEFSITYDSEDETKLFIRASVVSKHCLSTDQSFIDTGDFIDNYASRKIGILRSLDQELYSLSEVSLIQFIIKIYQIEMKAIVSSALYGETGTFDENIDITLIMSIEDISLCHI